MTSSEPYRPTALDNPGSPGLPWPVELVLAALHVVLLPLALLAIWIAMFVVAAAIVGAGTAPFAIVMIVVSALYFAGLSMWGAGGHS